jgi:hypothetical protein
MSAPSDAGGAPHVGSGDDAMRSPAAAGERADALASPLVGISPAGTSGAGAKRPRVGRDPASILRPIEAEAAPPAAAVAVRELLV